MQKVGMEYFLVHTDEQDSYLTIGIDNGFGVFWTTLTVGEFLERIEKLKVRIQ